MLTLKGYGVDRGFGSQSVKSDLSGIKAVSLNDMCDEILAFRYVPMLPDSLVEDDFFYPVGGLFYPVGGLSNVLMIHRCEGYLL